MYRNVLYIFYLKRRLSVITVQVQYIVLILFFLTNAHKLFHCNCHICCHGTENVYNDMYTGIAVPFWSCSQAVSKPVWHKPLLCVQGKTPDYGQRECPKHVKFYSKNKFEKLSASGWFYYKNLSRCTVTWTWKGLVWSVTNILALRLKFIVQKCSSLNNLVLVPSLYIHEFGCTDDSRETSTVETYRFLIINVIIWNCFQNVIQSA